MMKLKDKSRFFVKSILESWILLKCNSGNMTVSSHGSYMKEKAVTAKLK